VLSQLLSVTSFLKQKFEKIMETLAGHLKSAGEPHAGRGLDSTGVHYSYLAD